LVADALSFPTSVTFDDAGIAYIAEGGLPFGGAQPGGRIWRLSPNSERTLLAEGLRPPVNGLAFHRGYLYVSEGGHPGRISRFDLDGKQSVILDDLPGPGNYHTNMVAFGPDGKIYFSQGAMTNTGIVGLDAYQLGWLRRLPHAHDVPGCDIVLAGVNVESENPVDGQPGARVRTGGFVPFGTPTKPGQRVPAQLPCTAAVMRCNLDGSDLELVAWGLRNAYGLGFLPDGRLLATDQGADDRGSRPVGNAPDLLFEVRKGAWYGWPDFIGGDPIADSQYQPERGPGPTSLLANHSELPPPERPLLRFPPHSAAVKFEVVPSRVPEWGGQIFIALFGDERPVTAPAGPRAGRALVRIDPRDWSLHPFLASPLVRPIDVRFHPIESALHILDFGHFEVHEAHGVLARANSGQLWRVRLG
jgi:glucose/arabinose dehydrogenase